MSLQLRAEDVVLDEQDDASGAALLEVLKLMESNDEMLLELAGRLDIPLYCDGLALTAEQRRALSNNFLAGLVSDTFDTPPFELHEKAKKSDDDTLLGQAAKLGEQFDYDASVSTLEQRQAVFNKYWAMHCETFELRSSRYYEDKSQCLFVSEIAWPGAVAMLKAEKLKGGYIEPKDLIERLRK